jgi:CRP-like cAMP-binding protein
MEEQSGRQAELHSLVGMTPERMAELAGPLGWGDACRLLTVDEAMAGLRTFHLFAGVSDADLEEVARLTYECHWSAGTVIFHEREEARNFCLLVEGQVALEKEVRLGPHSPPRQATVQFLHPGHAMGWSSLVAPFHYTQSAVAVQPTRALCLDGQAFRDLMQRRPHLGVRIMSIIAELIGSRLEYQTRMLLYFLEEFRATSWITFLRPSIARAAQRRRLAWGWAFPLSNASWTHTVGASGPKVHTHPRSKHAVGLWWNFRSTRWRKDLFADPKRATTGNQATVNRV